MHSQFSQPADTLSPEKMQLFLATLQGLPADEVQKAKSLYIRNAISEYKAMEASFAGFGVAQGCFAIIPIFWPILYAQRRMHNAQRTLFAERIQNALEVWHDDLRGEVFDLPFEDSRY